MWVWVSWSNSFLKITHVIENFEENWRLDSPPPLHFLPVDDGDNEDVDADDADQDLQVGGSLLKPMAKRREPENGQFITQPLFEHGCIVI